MMYRLIAAIDTINRRVGHGVAWLALVLVAVQFGVVVLRYVFAIGFVWMQEIVLYLYGAMFMLGAGYALLRDAHVRVDVFYRNATQRTRALVDLLGSVLAIVPVCALVFWFSWDYVRLAWGVGEGSGEALGLPLAFAYKAVILVFAVLVGIQGCSLALKCAAFLAGKIERYEAGDPGSGGAVESRRATPR